MLRSYKYRVYPTNSQADMLSKYFGSCRWIWNWALAKKSEEYRKNRKDISRYELCAMLPLLKKSDSTSWLKETSAQSLQQVLVDLETAFTSFFKKKTSFPKFKKKHHCSNSCRFPQNFEIDFNESRILLPRLGRMVVIIDREFNGKPKSVTLSQDSSGKYYASVLVETGINNPAPTPYFDMLGIDLGLTHFATMSDGEKVNNPRFLTASLRKLAKEQRRLSRKKKGSKNRNKQRIRVALAYEKVANQRKDFLHKLSTKLIRENQAIALEDLNVAGMIKNRKLSRTISDASWSEFVRQLEYKALWYGKTVIKIGRFEPSSKLCTCGIINRELKLSDRIWTCQHCNVTHDRDILAANNIKHFAIGQGMPEFTPVESAGSQRPRRSRKSAVLG